MAMAQSSTKSKGEEAPEEAELVDPIIPAKEKCACTPECQKYQAKLDKCTTRVNSGTTDETCQEELFDFIHCVDHCVAKSLFQQLK